MSRIDEILEALGIDREDDEEEEEEDNQQEEEQEQEQQEQEQEVEELRDQVLQLESRLDEAMELAEQNEASVESSQQTIEELVERVEEVESNIIDLLSIYDALAAEVNPLFEDDFRSSLPEVDASDIGDPDSPFDLRGSDGKTVEDLAEEVNQGGEAPPQPPELEESEEKADEDSLKDNEGKSNEQEEQNNNSETMSENEQNFDGRVERNEPKPSPDEVNPRVRADSSDPYVHTIPQTYIGEIVALKWISELVTAVGFRRSIRILKQYESYGWISRNFRSEILTRLKHIDFDKNPEFERGESIPESFHEESFEELHKMKEISQ